jgi:hypothetical protein
MITFYYGKEIILKLSFVLKKIGTGFSLIFINPCHHPLYKNGHGRVLSRTTTPSLQPSRRAGLKTFIYKD